MPNGNKKLSATDMSNLSGDLSSHGPNASNPIGEKPDPETEPVKYKYWSRWEKEQKKQEATGFLKDQQPTPEKTVKDQYQEEIKIQNLEALGLDPDAMEAQYQKRVNRRERFKNIIQAGDNISDAVSKTTKNVAQEFENFKTGFIQKKNNFTNNFKKN